MRLYERLGWLRTGRVAHHFGRRQCVEAVCYVAPDAGPVPSVGVL